MWPFKVSISRLQRRGKFRAIGKLYLTSNDQVVVQEAIEALANKGGEETADLLAGLALGIAGAEARTRAFKLLIRLGDAAVSGLMSWCYLGKYVPEPDEFLWQTKMFEAGCRGLAEIGSERAMEALLNKLEEMGDKPRSEAEYVFQALKRFGAERLSNHYSMIKKRFDLNWSWTWHSSFLGFLASICPDADRALSDMRWLLDKAVSAADGYFPHSITARERKQHFAPGIEAMRFLTSKGFDQDIKRVAFISMQCITDDFVWSGLHTGAANAIRSSSRPLARLYSYIWDRKVEEARTLLIAHAELRSALDELAEVTADVWGAPTRLINSKATAIELRNQLK